jgi:hypothetical protein
MPGKISGISSGPKNNTPYVPSWLFDNGSARVCLCGCHEGYHNSSGRCLNTISCGCIGFAQDGSKTTE